MQKIFATALVLLLNNASAQVGIGTNSLNTSARLQVDASTSSNAKGFLPPRVTATERGTITTPAQGLMVYQTDATAGLYYYDGSSWIYIINSTNNILPVANGGTGVTTATGSGSVVLSTSPTLSTPTLGVATATSINNLTIGRGAGNLGGNIVLGESVLSSNTTGQHNTVVGYDAMKFNTTGWSNTAIGQSALSKNSTGNNSVAIGYQSLFNNTASNNDAVGYHAMYSNSSGESNVAIGQQSMNKNTTGNNNTVIGFTALPEKSTGSDNIAIGHYAGRTIADGTTLLTEINNSILIGADVRANANSQTNQIVIGHGAIGAGSNTIRLGNTSITAVNTSGTITANGFVKSGGTSSQFLMANGTATSSPSLSGATDLPLTTGVTGTLPVANGGTGVTSSTGSGSVALSNSPIFNSISIQTPSNGNSINISGNNSNASTINLYANNGSTRYGFFYTDPDGMQVGSYNSLPLRFMVGAATGSPIEYMRLTSNGRLGIGTNSPSAPLGITTSNDIAISVESTSSDNNGIITLNANTNSNFTSDWHEFISFRKQGTQIGRITSNGSASVSYSTSSDYRLKEDFKNFNGLDLINKIKVYDYAWITDKSRMFGFKAHEIQEVLPYLVSGKKDEIDAEGKPKHQMVDYSKLTPVLVKAVQEQQEFISKQNERIEKLEKLLQQLINQKE